MKDMMEPEGDNADIVNIFEHHMFKKHTCHSDCVKVFKKVVGRFVVRKERFCSQGSLIR